MDRGGHHNGGCCLPPPPSFGMPVAPGHRVVSCESPAMPGEEIKSGGVISIVRVLFSRIAARSACHHSRGLSHPFATSTQGPELSTDQVAASPSEVLWNAIDPITTPKDLQPAHRSAVPAMSRKTAAGRMGTAGPTPNESAESPAACPAGHPPPPPPACRRSARQYPPAMPHDCSVFSRECFTNRVL